MLEVLRQKAPDYDITVTTEDVNAQVVDIKEMFQGDQARFDAALKTETPHARAVQGVPAPAPPHR